MFNLLPATKLKIKWQYVAIIGFSLLLICALSVIGYKLFQPKPESNRSFGQESTKTQDKPQQQLQYLIKQRHRVLLIMNLLHDLARHNLDNVILRRLLIRNDNVALLFMVKSPAAWRQLRRWLRQLPYLRWQKVNPIQTPTVRQYAVLLKIDYHSLTNERDDKKLLSLLQDLGSDIDALARIAEQQQLFLNDVEGYHKKMQIGLVKQPIKMVLFGQFNHFYGFLSHVLRRHNIILHELSLTSGKRRRLALKILFDVVTMKR